MLGENTDVSPSGKRTCYICKKEKAKDWIEKNKEKRQSYFRRWQAENNDKVNNYSRKWAKDNPEKARSKNQRRRALKRGQLGEISVNIERILFRIQKGKCYYCEASLNYTGYHQDHKTPLSRGGFHEDVNLCLACPSCNLHKGCKTEAEYSNNA